jgi:hypothetical protein
MPGFHNYDHFCAANDLFNDPSCFSSISALSPISYKHNLTNPQRLKLMLHERSNYMNWKTINQSIRAGHLNVDKMVANCPDPICAACEYGKAKQHSHKTDQCSITAHHLYPGVGISADQLEAGSPGRLPTTGGLPASKRYKYCTVWIDHFSRYICPTFHDSKDASEMVSS